MTFNFKKSIKTIALVTIVSAFSSLPAIAGGSFSLSFQPTNAQDANALRTAFQLYSLVKQIDQAGSIHQNGYGNRAGMRQRGLGNRGIIFQDGNGHSASLDQDGYNNSYGIFQLGKNTRANVRQRGYGQTGATIIFGW